MESMERGEEDVSKDEGALRCRRRGDDHCTMTTRRPRARGRRRLCNTCNQERDDQGHDRHAQAIEPQGADDIRALAVILMDNEEVPEADALVELCMSQGLASCPE